MTECQKYRFFTSKTAFLPIFFVRESSCSEIRLVAIYNEQSTIIHQTIFANKRQLQRWAQFSLLKLNESQSTLMRCVCIWNATKNGCPDKRWCTQYPLHVLHWCHHLPINNNCRLISTAQTSNFVAKSIFSTNAPFRTRRKIICNKKNELTYQEIAAICLSDRLVSLFTFGAIFTQHVVDCEDGLSFYRLK